LDCKKVCKFLSCIESKLRLKRDIVYNIIFVDDKEIRKLNRKYRSKDRVTDVLSFRYESRDDVPACKDADIFISPKTAKRNAKLFKEEFYTEILRLIIHGILHSLDFSDYTKRTKEIMWSKQEDTLKCILHWD